jgi:ribonucleotide reductase alpha subunit
MQHSVHQWVLNGISLSVGLPSQAENIWSSGTKRQVPTELIKIWRFAIKGLGG